MTCPFQNRTLTKDIISLEVQGDNLIRDSTCRVMGLGKLVHYGDTWGGYGDYMAYRGY